MAKCPNCNNHLSSWNVISLQPKKNIIHCNKCGAYLIALVGPVVAMVTFFGLIGVTGLKFAKELKPTHFNWSLVLGLLSVGLFIYAFYFFVTKIQLFIYDGNAESIDAVQSEIIKLEEDSEFDAQLEHFKDLYKNKSDKELLAISTENGWQLPAKKAATDILQARQKNVT